MSNTTMQVFETRGRFVIASETNGQFRVPVRSESFSARVGGNLDAINLTGAYVYKTASGARRALAKLAGEV